MRYPHLPHAPIAEATIGVIVDAPDVTSAMLQQLATSLGDRFPMNRPREQIDALFNGVNGTVTTSVRSTGLQLRSADEKKLIQVMTNGFTYTQLPQYVNWDDLRDGARENWKLYQAATKPKAITNVVVRFINRIELPMPIGDFDDYFATFPRIAAGLPQLMGGLYMRMLIPFGSDAVATVTQAIDTEQLTDKVLPCVLGIEVGSQKRIETEDDLWAAIERFRDIKNQVFFESTTEKLRGLYQ